MPSVVGLVTSLLLGLVLIYTQPWHARWTLDNPAAGVQKFHHQATPRIGGIVLLLGFIVANAVYSGGLTELFKPLLIASLIPFFFGFGEDVTKRVSVAARLLASAAGAGIFIWLSDVYLHRLDVFLLDDLMTIPVFAIALTIFTVAGVTNSINIIDGFHGLASGVALIALGVFAILAYRTHDWELVRLCVLTTGVLLGFFILNYPFGKLFLGDGGAYFLGFTLAQMAILLPVRNDEVSPWVSLVVCAYPVVEVLYSMWRRHQQKSAASAPDNLHLHTLIKTKVIRPALQDYPQLSRMKNALVAPWIWLPTLLLAGWALYWSNSVPQLMAGFVLFVLWYHLTYRYLSKR